MARDASIYTNYKVTTRTFEYNNNGKVGNVAKVDNWKATLQYCTVLDLLQSLEEAGYGYGEEIQVLKNFGGKVLPRWVIVAAFVWFRAAEFCPVQ